MRKYHLLVICVLASTLAFGQKKYEMVVEKTDGTKTVYKTEDIVHIYFKENVDGSASYLTCPDDNHPHLIDLGIGTKWACCNVDAISPEGYGGFYAWGETSEKLDYSWGTYIHCDGSAETCHNLGESICGTDYDVAHVKWGGPWRMPFKTEIQVLLNNCSHTVTTKNGVKGMLFTGANGGSIFLPCAGYRSGTSIYGQGRDGDYWSGNPLIYDNGLVYGFLVNDNGFANWDYNRYYGLTVRPVAELSDEE